MSYFQTQLNKLRNKFVQPIVIAPSKLYFNSTKFTKSILAWIESSQTQIWIPQQVTNSVPLKGFIRLYPIERRKSKVISVTQNSESGE